jgi:hypothetical protein
MIAFEVCTSCSRHIKSVEAACPFCGTSHAPHVSRAVRRAPRMSRAAWLATTLASSLLVAGCTAEVAPSGEPSSENDAGGAPDAKAQQQYPDAAKDAVARETSAEDAAEEEPSADAGLDAADAAAEAEAGWHTCYGAPPARLERTQRGNRAG